MATGLTSNFSLFYNVPRTGSPSGYQWISTGNAQTLDSSGTYQSTPSGTGLTNQVHSVSSYLSAYQLVNNIPTSSTITGIAIRISRFFSNATASIGDSIYDYSVQLMYNNFQVMAAKQLLH